MEAVDVKIVSKKSSRKYFKAIKRSINKKDKALRYLDIKKIFKRAPKNIMKMRKRSETITCVFDINDWYFRVYYNEDILLMIDELVESHRIKKNSKSWIKYKAILNLYD